MSASSLPQTSTLTFINRNLPEAAAARFARVLARQIASRGGSLAPGGYLIAVSLNAAREADSFALTPADGGVSIEANNLCTLYAGLGWFLLHSRFDFAGGFTPAALPVQKKQANSIRGMYLASHFYNFWHVAPMEEVEPHLENFALWGCNTLMLCLAPQHYTSFKSPEAEEMIARLKALFAYAGELGIAPALILFSNTGFHDRPEELAAPWDQRGNYITPNYAELHKEICPSLPGGMDEIRRAHREFFEAFADVPVKYFAYWAYDEGGCTCDDCAPWSTNGFIRCYEESVKDQIAEFFPDAEIILSTWHFDRHLKDEGVDFYDKLAAGAYPWAKYIMAIHFDGTLMPALTARGVPAEHRFIDFPEISMWGAKPWGGFGANPIPLRLDNIADNGGGALDGGFPYSEGLWEDINTFLCITRYSGWYETTTDALRDYIRYYFGAGDGETESLLRAIQLMETTLWRGCERLADGRMRYPLRVPNGVREVYRLITEADAVLPESARTSWQWRIVYLRAVIDYELYRNDCIPAASTRAQACFAELKEIYHAHDPRIQPAVNPPLGL